MAEVRHFSASAIINYQIIFAKFHTILLNIAYLFSKLFINVFYKIGISLSRAGRGFHLSGICECRRKCI